MHRAYLNGWGAKYLPHVASPNEVPGSLSAYRTQQFRWLSGPMQIIVKAFFTIWHARDIGFMKRLNCYCFFARQVLLRPCQASARASRSCRSCRASGATGVQQEGGRRGVRILQTCCVPFTHCASQSRQCVPVPPTHVPHTHTCDELAGISSFP